jgi:hypothetical protein
MTQGADAALEGLAGALALTTEGILNLLPQPDELRRAA